MSDFGHLDKRILVRIFAIYLTFFEEFGRNGVLQYYFALPLNKVCRHWRDCIHRFIGNTVYIICYSPFPTIRSRFIELRSTKKSLERGRFLDNRLRATKEWRTNIPYIVKSGHYSNVDRVFLWALNCNLDFVNIADILQKFGFGQKLWHSVKTLSILESSRKTAQNTLHSDISDMDALTNTAFAYITKHLPSISSFTYISAKTHPNAEAKHLLERLMEFYMPRLTTLNLPSFDPFNFTHTSFSPYLTELDLRLSTKNLADLPKIFGPSLTKLSVSGIERDFAWDTFRGSFPGTVEFSNLTDLLMSFKASSSRDTWPPHARLPSLKLPKLRDLCIADHPFTSAYLYSIFKDSPLKSLRITLLIKYMDVSGIALLLKPIKLSLWIVAHTGTTHEDRLVETMVVSLFARVSAARIVEISIPTSIAVRLPAHMQWTKLERLFLRFPVYLSELTHFLGQLPHLRWLLVGAIYNPEPVSGSNTQDIQVWSTSIRVLCLFSSVSLIPMVPDLDSMCTLVSGLPSLQQLIVPDGMFGEVRDRLIKHGLSRYKSKLVSKMRNWIEIIRVKVVHAMIRRGAKLDTQNGYYEYTYQINPHVYFNVGFRLNLKHLSLAFHLISIVIIVPRQSSLFQDTKKGGHGIVEFEPHRLQSYIDRLPLIDYALIDVPVTRWQF